MKLGEIGPHDLKRWFNFVLKAWTNDEHVCWEWNGGKDEKGYGLFDLNGRTVRAHKVGFVAGWGFVPRKGHVLRHSCNNSSCVRWHHLWPGTHQQNAADRHAAGHTARFTNNGAGKLDEDDVVLIRANPHIDAAVLARHLRVSPRTIARVRSA